MKRYLVQILEIQSYSVYYQYMFIPPRGCAAVEKSSLFGRRTELLPELLPKVQRFSGLVCKNRRARRVNSLTRSNSGRYGTASASPKRQGEKADRVDLVPYSLCHQIGYMSGSQSGPARLQGVTPSQAAQSRLRSEWTLGAVRRDRWQPGHCGIGRKRLAHCPVQSSSKSPPCHSSTITVESFYTDCRGNSFINIYLSILDRQYPCLLNGTAFHYV